MSSADAILIRGIQIVSLIIIAIPFVIIGPVLASAVLVTHYSTCLPISNIVVFLKLASITGSFFCTTPSDMWRAVAAYSWSC